MSGSGETKCSPDFEQVTKSDSEDGPAYRALWCNGSGNVVIHNASGQSVTFTVEAAGLLPVQPKRVLDTGTTVTTIIGLF